MADDKYFGFEFPFEEDTKGRYVKMTKTDRARVKSNLTNLITTLKGERVRKPNFGTNLPQFIFEPMDEKTYADIRQEILAAVAKYMVDVDVVGVEIKADEEAHLVGVRISYTISEGLFKVPDEIDILF